LSASRLHGPRPPPAAEFIDAAAEMTIDPKSLLSEHYL
jgi:hypothetical protein